MNRIQERKTAFEIIFTIPFYSPDTDVSELLENYIGVGEEPPELTDYIIGTVKGVSSHITEIDERIRASLKARRFERLDRVCLAILRLATYEMLYNDEVPVSVAINEAIELTKEYNDELAAFVHGNLGAIAESVK